MPSHALAMIAAANAHVERGIGHTLVAPGNKFFCGFEQQDGSVVSAPFRQEPNPGGEPVFSKFAAGEFQYTTDKPLFLSPAELKEKGLAAAAFGHRSIAIQENGLPKALVEELRVASVHKDLTYEPMHCRWATIFDGPPSQAGLASPKACEAAEDYVYISLRKEFSEQVRQVKSVIRNLFKPGGPS